MAALATMLPVNPIQDEEENEKVYFHSGSTPTYRAVSKGAVAFTSIPTIDLAAVDSPSLDVRKGIAREIYDACSSCGFFYVKNHGIPEALIEDTFAVLKRFFDLDHEAKMEAHVQKNPAIRGYEPMFETRLDPRTKGDLKEAFTMGDCPLEPEQNYVSKTGHAPPSNLTRAQNIWPPEAPWFRDGVYAYYNAVFPLALKLVHIFALSFGLPETALDPLFKFPITGMRPLHYPPMPPDNSEASVGLGAHSDFSWLTLVLQSPSTPALEVLSPSGRWVPAPPVPGTLVCNVGQYLERQSNGIFPATVHRVCNMTGERRHSLPFFLTPDHDAEMGVLECCVPKGEMAKFENINVGELYVRRVLAARRKHPTSKKYWDVPMEEWRYDMLLS